VQPLRITINAGLMTNYSTHSSVSGVAAVYESRGGGIRQGALVGSSRNNPLKRVTPSRGSPRPFCGLTIRKGEPVLCDHTAREGSPTSVFFCDGEGGVGGTEGRRRHLF